MGAYNHEWTVKCTLHTNRYTKKIIWSLPEDKIFSFQWSKSTFDRISKLKQFTVLYWLLLQISVKLHAFYENVADRPLWITIMLSVYWQYVSISELSWHRGSLAVLRCTLDCMKYWYIESVPSKRPWIIKTPGTMKNI